jgi:hypothetical protein
MKYYLKLHRDDAEAEIDKDSMLYNYPSVTKFLDMFEKDDYIREISFQFISDIVIVRKY